MKLAVAQYATCETLAETMELLESVVQKASGACVDLILFPEAFLGGYPRTCNFGVAVGSRSEKGRDQYYEYWQECVDLGDSCPDGTGVYKDGAGDGTREKLEKIAEKWGVFLVVGVVERCGGTLYCACVFVDPGRGVVGKRRKVMPTGAERVVWGLGSTKTLKAVEATLCGEEVILGAAICWENYMPLLRASLYSQSVSVYLAPTADARESWMSTMRHIAKEGRCFVLTCNQFVTSNTLPKYVDGYVYKNVGETLEIVSSGGSAIVGPMGDVLEGPMVGEEGLLVSDDLHVERHVVRAKMDMDVGLGGHYARGDVFKLSVEGLDLSPPPNEGPAMMVVITTKQEKTKLAVVLFWTVNERKGLERFAR
ncbi:carbon-nitrogen hydrolase [Morchella snyderi]|nr:carbon-nitrogen hydrolase [Morchella snyderi]